MKVYGVYHSTLGLIHLADELEYAHRLVAENCKMVNDEYDTSDFEIRVFEATGEIIDSAKYVKENY